MTRFYLGIDGGQSSTTALIANETGRVIGSGRGGPCNHVRASEGRTKFIRAIGQSVEGACHEAGIDRNSLLFAAACLGFSGGPEDKDAYSRELIRSLKYKITHDAEIALSGATAGNPGIIVIAGTGSIAFGRNAARNSARAGGWGYIFGDEGSAFDLVRCALRAALRFEEGWGPATRLRTLLLETTGAENADRLLHLFYTEAYSRSVIASFAPLVTQAAEEADEVARAILSDAAEKLAWFVEGVYRQLFRANEGIPVAYIGGVFQSMALLAHFKLRVRDTIGCNAEGPHFGPACGAVLEALHLDNNPSELSNVPKSEK